MPPTGWDSQGCLHLREFRPEVTPDSAMRPRVRSAYGRSIGNVDPMTIAGPIPTGTLRLEDAVNETCPWSGKPIAPDSLTRYAGAVVGFCNQGCRDKFDTAIRHFEQALQARRVTASGGGE